MSSVADCPELQELLAHTPEDYRALCRLGLEKQQSDRLEDARRCYAAALRVAPPSHELAHNFGGVCRRLGD